MDYLKKIDKIINILSINGKNDFVKIILEIQSNSFTSSELLLSVVYELNAIIKNNLEISILIGKDVKELIDYCRKIGLYIEN